MPATNKKVDPIPESFASIEEAAEFWDTHSVADYWDETQEVHFEINIPRRTVAIERNLAENLRQLARQQGVSLETLVNLWLQERLRETTPAV